MQKLIKTRTMNDRVLNTMAKTGIPLFAVFGFLDDTSPAVAIMNAMS